MKAIESHRKASYFDSKGKIPEIDMPQTVAVNVEWDAEAKVWIAESNDVPGLATGADTLEELIERLKVAIPEMLTENGIAFEPGLRFKIDAERSESIAA